MNKLTIPLLLLSLACAAQSALPTLKDTPSPSNAPAPSFQREYTVTDSLHIRTGAGKEYPVKGVLHTGDTVTCSEWSGNWCRHELGWSNGGWLK